MGIYVRKKKKSSFKIFLFLLIFFALTFTAYYFFSISPQIKFFKDLEISKNNNKELPNPISESLEQTDIDLSIYLKKDEIDKSIKNFITENPDFLLDILREYQNKQNQLEQEKINIENSTNIEKLNSLNQTMFIGDEFANKIIYEFVDYNCGYCQKFHNEIVDVITKDSSIKLIIIQMPILGKMSDELSKLALASSFQGKFEEVHNYLYSSNRRSSMEDILSDLFLIDVDLKQLEIDLASEALLELVSQQQEIVNIFKFTGTPAIIIGSKIIPGFINSEQIYEILEEEFS